MGVHIDNDIGTPFCFDEDSEYQFEDIDWVGEILEVIGNIHQNPELLS